MANQATARAAASEPIDRLEDKIKLLVGVVTELRVAQQKADAQQAALSAEIETLRARLNEADGASTELVALRQERDVIRDRVAGMLEQLEGLHL